MKIRNIIESGCIRVNKRSILCDLYVKPGSLISAYLEPRNYHCDFKWNKMKHFNFKKELKDWNVVHEHSRDYFVIDKPPGLSTIPPKDTRLSLVPYWLKRTLSRQLGVANILVTSRLDVGTHGLVVVGRTKDYVKHHNGIIERGNISKKYTAVVEGWDPKVHKIGLWEHYFHERMSLNEERPLQLGETNFSYIPEGFDHLKVKASRTKSDYHCVHVKMIVEKSTLANEDSVALRAYDKEWVKELLQKKQLYELEIELLTGKTHQIRAQLEGEGVIIIGDWLYGSKHVPSDDTFALCCRQLSWKCPKTGEMKSFEV